MSRLAPFLLCVTAGLLAAMLVAGRSVEVKLRAPWRATSLVAEASEAFGQFSNADFWKFADLVADRVVGPSAAENELPSGAQGEYALVLSYLPVMLPSEGTQKLVRAEVAARVYSPAVQAEHEGAEVRLREIASSSASDCDTTDAFAVVEGERSEGPVLACSESALAAALERLPTCKASSSSSSQVALGDAGRRVRPALRRRAQDAAPPPPCTNVTLYGILGTPFTSKLYRKITQHIKDSPKAAIRFIFSHYNPRREGDESLPLQGYGITLDVKNMEYKAVDEKDKGSNAEKAEEAASAASNATDEELKAASEEQAKLEAKRQNIERTIAGLDIPTLLRRFPTLSDNVTSFAKGRLFDIEHRKLNRKESDDEDSMDLKIWELQNLGYQVASYILSSNFPLSSFVELLNNFPARVSRISKLSVKSDVRDDIQRLQSIWGDGRTRAWLNGRLIETHKMDLFNVLGQIREQETLSLRLQDAFLNDGARGSRYPSAQGDDSYVREVVDSLTKCDIEAPSSQMKARFWLEDAAIDWINDIEKDEMYAGMPTKLREMLRPSMYGQPRFVGRNILNFVSLIDPSQPEASEIVNSNLRRMEQGLPIRQGVVIVDRAASSISLDGDRVISSALNANGIENGGQIESVPVSTAIACIYNYLLKEKGIQQALVFISSVHTRGGAQDDDGERRAAAPLTLSGVLAAASDFGVTDVPVAELERVQQTAQIVEKLGITRFPATLFNGILSMEENDGALYKGFQTEFPLLKSLIDKKVLSDDTKDLLTTIMQHHGALRRYQPAVFENVAFHPWSSLDHAKLLQTTTWLFGPDYQYQVPLLSHTLAIGSNAAGLKAVGQLLEYVSQCKESCARTRYSFLECDHSPFAGALRAVAFAAESFPEKKRIFFVRQYVLTLQEVGADDEDLTDDAKFKALHDKVLTALGNKYALVKEYMDQADSRVADNVRYCSALRDRTGHADEGPVLHTNGRVTRIDQNWLAEDFALVENDEFSRAEKAEKCAGSIQYFALSNGTLSGDDLSSDFYGNKLVAIHSVLVADLALFGARLSDAELPDAKGGYRHNFRVGPRNAQHHFVAIVDPISRESQRLISIVDYLTKTFDLEARIFLNPQASVTSVPIKSFYSFVASSDVRFDGEQVAEPKAVLRRLPAKDVLTMGTDEPDSWLVFASKAKDDLDNIRLDQMVPEKNGIFTAEYALQSLVVSGSCIDESTKAPPRGLPLEISSPSYQKRDTLVMSNFGYFQLQGLPGSWTLAIQEGRATEIHNIKSVDGNRGADKNVFHLNSFTGRTFQLRVDRNPGQEKASLLWSDVDSKAQKGGEEKSGGLASFFGYGDAQDDEDAKKKPTWPPTEGDLPEKPSRPTLNIFSLASGHLYERFLRLMMYTVMKTSSDVHGKNTTRIKFWLIENSMSPRFKKLLPHLAKQYNFEYGLVQYKWPHWLRKQTEKQRFIWAYKILFLDVLFPLSVEKVIFVDADQIVQSDLHELYNLDLQGNPVAYTPFCQVNKREDTSGFRFWDSGYWNDHLRGKPYHISAIYVVDLTRLRQLAAGDQYRGIYENLSADPNSLANLDQDLPNFAQHQVPIFSLPEEWLWCETWCNEDSKKKAKTIDLCNNPKTKTPKLENAKRIVPDWTFMDNVLSDFEKLVLPPSDE